jgi:hypothetical protein
MYFFEYFNELYKKKRAHKVTARSGKKDPVKSKNGIKIVKVEGKYIEKKELTLFLE